MCNQLSHTLHGFRHSLRLARRKSARHRSGPRSVSLSALLLLGLLAGNAAQAQSGNGLDGPGTPSAAPGQVAPVPSPGAPGGRPGKMPAIPPLPVLFGGADLLLTIDRPYDAAKLYRLILLLDPKNAAAKKGLSDALYAERPTFTALIHTYRDTIENRLTTYGGGPTFRTRYGKATILLGTGYFGENIHTNKPNETLGFLDSSLDDHQLAKSTANLILEPYFGKWEGYFFYNHTFYGGAPDRDLFNVKVSFVERPGRERFSLAFMRNDSFIQSDQLQFFAPETFYAVKEGLTEDITNAEIQYPLDTKIDADINYEYISYNDGNTRNLLRSQVLYRLLPKSRQAFPLLQVGLQHVFDDTRLFGVYYYTPQAYQAISSVASFIWLTRKWKFGLFGTYPFVRVRGEGYGKYDPLATLFISGSYQMTKATEVYAKLTSSKRTGNSAAFTDFVFGINQRF